MADPFSMESPPRDLSEALLLADDSSRMAFIVRHMTREEERDRSYIERFSDISMKLKLLDKLERDFSKIIWVGVGASVMLGAFLGVLLYIYTSDKTQVAQLSAQQVQLQQAIYEQGTAIKVLTQQLLDLRERQRAMEGRP